MKAPNCGHDQRVLYPKLPGRLKLFASNAIGKVVAPVIRNRSHEDNGTDVRLKWALWTLGPHVCEAIDAKVTQHRRRR